MEENQENTRKLVLRIVKRNEAIENFCDECLRLPAEDRRKVGRFLQRHGNPKNGAQSEELEQWTISEMRDWHNELRDISPNVANAWLPCMLDLLELKLSREWARFALLGLAESLESRM